MPLVLLLLLSALIISVIPSLSHSFPRRRRLAPAPPPCPCLTCSNSSPPPMPAYAVRLNPASPSSLEGNATLFLAIDSGVGTIVRALIRSNPGPGDGTFCAVLDHSSETDLLSSLLQMTARLLRLSVGSRLSSGDSSPVLPRRRRSRSRCDRSRHIFNSRARTPATAASSISSRKMTDVFQTKMGPLWCSGDEPTDLTSSSSSRSHD